MSTAVCTLFEGDYHFGVGVLTNSLYRHGFRGVVWAGYRGALPPWVSSLKAGQGYQEFSVAEGCVIRFVQLSTEKFLSNYKPDFMLELWESYCPEAENLFYFDPDIVNKCSWSYYERWVNRGITLCGEVNYWMPANHPHRLAWREFAENNGHVCQRELDYYFNSGFIGIKQNNKTVILLWQKLLETCEMAGYISLKDFHFTDFTPVYPYFTGDQCVFNLALMLTSYPLSPIGPEGMDFCRQGTIMSHAVGPSPKPWRKQTIISALNGMPPTITEKLFWQNTQAPIQVYTQTKNLLKSFELRCGTAIGRFIHRA